MLNREQIMREVGSSSYNRAALLGSGPDHTWVRDLVNEIQEHYVGPDAYWHNLSEDAVPGHTRYFGHAWLVPFPPTVVGDPIAFQPAHLKDIYWC